MNTTLLKALSIFSFVLISLSLKAQIKIIEVNASALVEDKTVSDYSILIYNDGHLKDSVFCKKSKATSLELESGKLYSIVLKKVNYASKLVIVDTKIPSGLRELVEEPFELQIELAQKSTALKEELMDHPIAILTVNKKEKSLMASENYHKFTHN